jgi:PPOX class probable F420-dependent enzyme
MTHPRPTVVRWNNFPMTLSHTYQKALARGCSAIWLPTAAPWWHLFGSSSTVASWRSTPAKTTAKGRALGRDPRVVMCVDEPRPPYSFVQVQGIASISEDPQDVLDIATRTGGRYMGADRAEEFGRRNGVPGELVVRIKPTTVRKAFNVAE